MLIDANVKSPGLKYQAQELCTSFNIRNILAMKIYIEKERESIFKKIYIIYLYVFVCFIFPHTFFFFLVQM